MDFVNEKQRCLAGSRMARGFLENPFQIANAGEDSGDLREQQARLIGDQPRDGRLADTRRPPEDERGKRAAREHARQRAVGPQEMILAGDVGERRRAQAVGERPWLLGAVPGAG